MEDLTTAVLLPASTSEQADLLGPDDPREQTAFRTMRLFGPLMLNRVNTTKWKNILMSTAQMNELTFGVISAVPGGVTAEIRRYTRSEP